MAKSRLNDLNFDYTPMCDKTVVKMLIENRFLVESQLEHGMVNEDIIMTYVDLDRVIERASLSGGEMATVSMLMDGYCLTDISSLFGWQRQAASVYERRALQKICDASVELWKEFHGERMARGVCY